MIYKALLLDIDGTIVQIKKNGMNSLPSKKILTYIKKASKKINICFSTGRAYSSVLPLIDYLGIKGPSIICNGAQIINSETKKIIIEKSINKDNAKIIFKKMGDIPFYINTGTRDIKYKKGTDPKKVLSIFTKAEISIIKKIEKFLSEIPNISYHRYPCWQKKQSGIFISNSLANKEDGLSDIVKILNLKNDEIIGVGDGYNDLQMIKKCGLKIAMANAVPELKLIADYIAPSVDDEGVVDIIKKYILVD